MGGNKEKHGQHFNEAYWKCWWHRWPFLQLYVVWSFHATFHHLPPLKEKNKTKKAMRMIKALKCKSTRLSAFLYSKPFDWSFSERGRLLLVLNAESLHWRLNTALVKSCSILSPERHWAIQTSSSGAARGSTNHNTPAMKSRCHHASDRPTSK